MKKHSRLDHRYLAGIQAFNAGDYFDAHEIWEGLWRDCPPEPRRFYHALIQAAVAIYHARRGNRSGAERLYHAGREKMAPYPEQFLGLNAPKFWAEVRAAIDPIHPDLSPPQIVLENE